MDSKTEKAIQSMENGNVFYIYINNSKTPVTIFYVPAVPDELGSFYWCGVGQRVMHDSCRLPLGLLTDVYTGKQTQSFLRNPAAHHTPDNVCFSLCSTSISLDLETVSEEVVNDWLIGLNHILTSDGKEVVEEADDEPLTDSPNADVASAAETAPDTEANDEMPLASSAHHMSAEAEAGAAARVEAEAAHKEDGLQPIQRGAVVVRYIGARASLWFACQYRRTGEMLGTLQLVPIAPSAPKHAEAEGEEEISGHDARALHTLLSTEARALLRAVACGGLACSATTRAQFSSLTNGVCELRGGATSVSLDEMTDLFLGAEHANYAEHSDADPHACVTVAGDGYAASLELPDKQVLALWLDDINRLLSDAGTDVVAVADTTEDEFEPEKEMAPSKPAQQTRRFTVMRSDAPTAAPVPVASAAVPPPLPATAAPAAPAPAAGATAPGAAIVAAGDSTSVSARLSPELAAVGRALEEGLPCTLFPHALPALIAHEHAHQALVLLSRPKREVLGRIDLAGLRSLATGTNISALRDCAWPERAVTLSGSAVAVANGAATLTGHTSSWSLALQSVDATHALLRWVEAAAKAVGGCVLSEALMEAGDAALHTRRFTLSPPDHANTTADASAATNPGSAGTSLGASTEALLEVLREGRVFTGYAERDGQVLRNKLTLFYMSPEELLAIARSEPSAAEDPIRASRIKASVGRVRAHTQGRLCWCAAGRRVPVRDAFVELGDITDIFLGKQTTLLQSAASTEPSERCFSILTARDQLDLAADSALTVHAWVDAMHAALTRAGRQVASAAQSTVQPLFSNAQPLDPMAAARASVAARDAALVAAPSQATPATTVAVADVRVAAGACGRRLSVLPPSRPSMATQPASALAVVGEDATAEVPGLTPSTSATPPPLLTSATASAAPAVASASATAPVPAGVASVQKTVLQPLTAVADEALQHQMLLERGARMVRYFTAQGQPSAQQVWVYYTASADPKKRLGSLRWLPLAALATALGVAAADTPSAADVFEPSAWAQSVCAQLEALAVAPLAQVLQKAADVAASGPVIVGANGALRLGCVTDVYSGRTTASLKALVPADAHKACFSIVGKDKHKNQTVVSLRAASASIANAWLRAVHRLLTTGADKALVATTTSQQQAGSRRFSVVPDLASQTGATAAPASKQRRLTVRSTAQPSHAAPATPVATIAEEPEGTDTTAAAVAAATPTATASAQKARRYTVTRSAAPAPALPQVAETVWRDVSESPEAQVLLLGVPVIVLCDLAQDAAAVECTAALCGGDVAMVSAGAADAHIVAKRCQLYYSRVAGKSGGLFVHPLPAQHATEGHALALTPADKTARAAAEARKLSRTSHECIPLHALTDIMVGKADPIFKRAASAGTLTALRSDTCLSVLAKQRQLHVVFADKRAARACVEALQAIIGKCGKKVIYDEPVKPPTKAPAATCTTAAAGAASATLGPQLANLIAGVPGRVWTSTGAVSVRWTHHPGTDVMFAAYASNEAPADSNLSAASPLAPPARAFDILLTPPCAEQDTSPLHASDTAWRAAAEVPSGSGARGVLCVKHADSQHKVWLPVAALTELAVPPFASLPAPARALKVAERDVAAVLSFAVTDGSQHHIVCGADNADDAAELRAWLTRTLQPQRNHATGTAAATDTSTTTPTIATAAAPSTQAGSSAVPALPSLAEATRVLSAAVRFTQVYAASDPEGLGTCDPEMAARDVRCRQVDVSYEADSHALTFVAAGAPRRVCFGADGATPQNVVYLDYLSDLYFGCATDAMKMARAKGLVKGIDDACLSVCADRPSFVGGETTHMQLHLEAASAGACQQWFAALQTVLSARGAALEVDT